SGGENISSIDVEIALNRHPAVLMSAVVARPDEKWGETPCAFVQLRPDATATEEELIRFCRDNLPHFAIPKTVVFGTLPTTSTGRAKKSPPRGGAGPLWASRSPARRSSIRVFRTIGCSRTAPPAIPRTWRSSSAT